MNTNTATPLFFANHQVGSTRIAAVHADIQKKYPQALASASQSAKPLQLVTPASATLNTNTLQPASQTTPSTLALQSKSSPVNVSINAETQNMASAKPATSITAAGGNLLQTLQPEEIRVLGLINEKGYLARGDLNKQFNELEVKALPGVLEELAQKKLIRTVGSQPNDGFVLTDTAAQAFGPAQKP